MKYNQSTGKIKKQINIQAYLHMNPLENYFTKKLFYAFYSNNNYSNIIFFKYDIV